MANLLFIPLIFATKFNQLIFLIKFNQFIIAKYLFLKFIFKIYYLFNQFIMNFLFQKFIIAYYLFNHHIFSINYLFDQFIIKQIISITITTILYSLVKFHLTSPTTAVQCLRKSILSFLSKQIYVGIPHQFKNILTVLLEFILV